MTFSIPAHKCGLVIGRGGENVKSINQQTGAFVEISRQPPPNGDPNFKLFIIRGSPQQIDHAKQLIEEKIEVLIILVSSCMQKKKLKCRSWTCDHKTKIASAVDIFMSFAVVSYLC